MDTPRRSITPQPNAQSEVSSLPHAERAGNVQIDTGGRAGRNLAAVLALGLVFLGVASLVKPDPRGASASTANTSQEHAGKSVEDVLGALIAAKHPQGWKLTGALKDTQFLVLIHSSPMGARYSVFSHQGRLLQGDMFADDVYRSFPTLDVSKFQLDPAQPGQAKPAGSIMLAEPAQRVD